MIFNAKKRKLLRDYADGLYNLDGPLMNKRRQKKRPLTDKSADIRNGIVRNYVIPLWGELRLTDLTVKNVDDALIGLDRISGGHKNIILNILDDIFMQAASANGKILYNPIKDIMKFSRAIQHPRNAIPKDEMEKLFPESRERLIGIWGRQIYATAYLVLRDTGLRPGELRALQWSDWYPDLMFFPVTKAIESGKRDKVKETKTGSVKPAIVKEQTAKELEILRKSTKDYSPEKFIFSDKRGPFTIGRLAYNFKKGVIRAGLNKPEYSPYWLRHTFNTRMLEVLPDEIVRLLMGHATEAMTRHYRHPDIESLKQEAIKIREALKSKEVI